MAKKLIGMHGAGGNDSVFGGYGSCGNYPQISGVTVIPLSDPGNWYRPINELLAFVLPHCQPGDDVGLCGFSMGGGGVGRIFQSGNNLNGCLRFIVMDDPAQPALWPGAPASIGTPAPGVKLLLGPAFNGSTYAVEDIGPGGNGWSRGGLEAFAAAYGLPARGAASNAKGRFITNPYYGYHHPWTNPDCNGNQIGNPAGYPEAASTSDWWVAGSSGGGGDPTPPPVTTTDAWPRYHAENMLLLNPQSGGFAKISTNPGYLGSGYVGQWYQTPENLRAVVQPPTAGKYNLKIRYRTASSGSQRRLRIGGVDKGVITFPQNATNWSDNSWTEHTIENLDLVAAAQNVDLEYVSGGGPDVDEFNFVAFSSGGGGNPTPDPTPNAFATKTSRPGYSSTGYVGGWDELNETVRWPLVQIPTTGAYKLDFRFANKNATSVSRDVYIDLLKVGTVVFAKTASGDTDNAWGSVLFTTPSITAGNHSIELRVAAGQLGLIDIDRMTLIRPGTTTPPAPSGSETVVQAETGGLSGVVDPATGAAIQSANPGFTGTGYIGRWYQNGETLTVTLNAPKYGTYKLRFRYRNGNASTTAIRQFKVNGVAQTDLQFPKNAATWTANTWTNQTRDGVLLTVGANALSFTCPNAASMGVDLDEVGFTLEQELTPPSSGGDPGTGGGTVTPPPTPIVDITWTGTNGAAWPSPWVTGYLSTGTTATILNNKGRVALSAAGGYSASSDMIAHTSLADGDLYCDITLPVANTSEYYARVMVRSDGVNAVQYGIQVDYTGLVNLYKQNASYAKTSMGTPVDLAVTAGSVVHVHLYISGTTIKGRTWLDSAAEPSTWNVGDLTDSTITGAGRWGVGATGGNAAVANNVDFDNFKIYNPIDTGGLPPVGGGGGGAATVIGGVSLFPANNVWYSTVTTLPKRSDSDARIAGTMANNNKFSSYGYHNQVTCDFGSGTVNGRPYGFSYTVVPGSQTKLPISVFYASESESGPVPYVASQPLEHNTDYHAIAVDQAGFLWESWDTHYVSPGFTAGSLAKWNLATNDMRPVGWTSADAAGMPMLPGSVQDTEVASGVIGHALRICVDWCSAEYEWPANHVAQWDLGVRGDLMKMGTRLRLKASVDINSKGLGPQAKIIAQCLKDYGAIVIDIGPNWKINGCAGPGWNNADLSTIGALMGTDFEVVDVSSLITSNPRSMSTTQTSSIPAGTKTATDNTLPAGLSGTHGAATRKTLTLYPGMISYWGVDYLNDELERYRSSQVQNRIGGGVNLIAAKDASIPTGYKSGMVNTFDGSTSTFSDPNNQGVQVGDFVQALVKMPSGQGFWPAVWMYDWEGGTSGNMEIDIMEMLGHQPTVIYHTNHTDGVQTGQLVKSASPAGGYHRFGVWLRPTGNLCEFFINGVSQGTLAYVPTKPTSGKWACIVNLAVGGSWPGSPNASTVFPSTMELVDLARWRP